VARRRGVGAASGSAVVIGRSVVIGVVVGAITIGIVVRGSTVRVASTRGAVVVSLGVSSGTRHLGIVKVLAKELL